CFSLCPGTLFQEGGPLARVWQAAPRSFILSTTAKKAICPRKYRQPCRSRLALLATTAGLIRKFLRPCQSLGVKTTITIVTPGTSTGPARGPSVSSNDCENFVSNIPILCHHALQWAFDARVACGYGLPNGHCGANLAQCLL